MLIYIDASPLESRGKSW